MAFAADAIEDDAGDAHRRIVRRKTAHECGRRLRLPRHVEHEDDRQAKMRGEIGGGAAPAGLRRGAVEQTHDAFDDHDIGAAGGVRGERVEQRAPSPSYRD